MFKSLNISPGQISIIEYFNDEMKFNILLLNQFNAEGHMDSGLTTHLF